MGKKSAFEKQLRGALKGAAQGVGRATGISHQVNVAKKLDSQAVMRAITSGAVNAARREVKFAGNDLAGRGAYMAGRGAYMAGRGSYDDLNPDMPGMHNNLYAGGSAKKHDPQMNGKRMENGSVIFTKKEYVTSINSTGSADFSVQSFQVNPGLSAVFPFLAQLADNFTEYEALQMRFIYEPVVSPMSASSVGSLGTIIMASDANAAYPTFATFKEMAEYSGANRGRISDCFNLLIECAPAQNSNHSRLYVRTGALGPNLDIKTYDLAKFQIGLHGIPTAYPAGLQLGLLWVEYSIVLRKPRLFTGAGRSIFTDMFWSTPGTGVSISAPLGITPYKSTANTLGGTVSKSGGSIYTFPDDFSGSVLVTFSATDTTGGTSVLALTSSGNITAYEALINNGLSTYDVRSSGSSIAEAAMKCYTVEAATVGIPNYIHLSVSTFGANPCAFLKVELIHPGFGNAATDGVFV